MISFIMDYEFSMDLVRVYHANTYLQYMVCLLYTSALVFNPDAIRVFEG